jgi:predicted MFS family arabinose efflux permease
MLGGWLAQQYGWRTTLVIFGLSGLVLLPLTHFILKEPRHLPQFTPTAGSVESMAASLRICSASLPSSIS